MHRLFACALLPSLFLVTSALHAQSAVDERAIVAVAGSLDGAVDAKNWKAARSLFLEQITVELPDTEPTDMAADALVGMWREKLHEGKTSFHLRGGEVVTFDGADSAVLRSKVHAWYHLEGVPGDDLYELWGDYRYELDRTEDGWRIRRFAFVPRLERGNAAVVSHRLPPTEAAPSEAGEEDEDRSADGEADAAAGTDDGDTGQQPDGG